MGKHGTTTFAEHPLFPFDDDEESKEIAFINVIRHEDGRSKQVPRMFRATELQSLQDIFSLFGGGLYELWGRGPSTTNDPNRPGRIAANRRYEIAGLSKPLVDDGSHVAPVGPAHNAPAAVVQQQSAQPVETSVMGMFMQMQMAMMQQSQETARQQAEAQRRADERARADSQQMMQMIATMQSQSTQSMMGVVTAMISTAKGGGGAAEMSQYAELFGKMGLLQKVEGAAEEAGGGGVGEIISNLADIVQGAVQLKEGGGLLGAPAPAPGSAAALMGTSPFKTPPPGSQGGQGGAPVAP